MVSVVYYKYNLLGKPAALEDSTDVDWVPTLHVKVSSSVNKKFGKNHRENGNRRDSSRSSHSSKVGLICLSIMLPI